MVLSWDMCCLQMPILTLLIAESRFTDNSVKWTAKTIRPWSSSTQRDLAGMPLDGYVRTFQMGSFGLSVDLPNK